jgi:hypothetical protein
MVAYFKTNKLARHHADTKVSRALEHSAGLAAAFFKESVPVTLQGRKTLAIKVQDGRFERVMDKVTRAIYFHHLKGQKLLVPIRIHSTAFSQYEADIAQAHAQLALAAGQLFTGKPVHGANPDVFQYQLLLDHKEIAHLVHLRFYGAFDVYATWGPRITG